MIDLGEAQLADRYETVKKRLYTPEYVSPERLEGKEASLASDMWLDETLSSQSRKACIIM